MKVRLKLHCEVTADDDAPPELMRQIELSTAVFVEQFEAHWVEALEKLNRKHPDLKFRLCDEDEEDGR